MLLIFYVIIFYKNIIKLIIYNTVTIKVNKI